MPFFGAPTTWLSNMASLFRFPQTAPFVDVILFGQELRIGPRPSRWSNLSADVSSSDLQERAAIVGTMGTCFDA